MTSLSPSRVELLQSLARMVKLLKMAQDEIPWSMDFESAIEEAEHLLRAEEPEK